MTAGQSPARPPRWAGISAAAGALAAQWAAHTAEPRLPFAPFSIGDWIIRRIPGSIASAAIDRLGHNALPVFAGVTVLAALGLGLFLYRLRPVALGAVAKSCTLGAASVDPRHPGPTRSLFSAIIAAAAAYAIASLLRPDADHGPALSAPSRRRFIIGTTAVFGGAILGTASLRKALRTSPAEAVRADRPASDSGDASFPAPDDLSPLITATADHYVVKIDLVDPALATDDWRLKLGGDVEHPLSLTLADLRGMPTVERIVTLSCISNPVGGRLAGNARWTGVPLADLLRVAHPLPGSSIVEARAADGYNDTYPLTLAADPDVMLAFGMNGALLSKSHGFPARLLVPGRYGMRSVKWVTDLTVGRDDPRGYWARRGWDPHAIVHTQSRIDTPSDHSEGVSPVSVGGVAWAGTRGVAAVETSVDDGASWQTARLERSAGPLSWRRWQTTVALSPGTHTIAARAIDGGGRTQDPQRRPPHPAGATGYHRIVVTVTG